MRIPYTRLHALNAAFGMGRGSVPARRRCSYGPVWSVTSRRRREITPSGIAVGFADDSEYVGGLQQRLVPSVMAVLFHPAPPRSTMDGVLVT
jgi:hypothetical protein